MYIFLHDCRYFTISVIYFRSIKSYTDWKNSPVLTTVMTTAYPIKLVDFPAVTICSQGMDEDVFSTGMISSFLKFLKIKKEITIPGLTPILAENLVYSQVN